MKNRKKKKKNSRDVTISSNRGIGTIRNINFVFSETYTVRFEEGGRISHVVGLP